MALQFRRGVINDLPDPSDAAIGEPLFTTDEGKLRIKKADGTYAVIGSGTSTGELDLSEIAAGSLVKVNTGQDGFVAAAGTDLPSHTQDISTINGLQDALDEKVELADLPQNVDGTLDLAKESTLTDFISEFPTDPATGNLDIAQESTLQSFSTQVSALESSVNALGYLSTYFSATALPASAPSTNGFLSYDTTSSRWSLVTSTATAPTEINGGNAASFGD